MIMMSLIWFGEYWCSVELALGHQIRLFS